MKNRQGKTLRRWGGGAGRLLMMGLVMAGMAVVGMAQERRLHVARVSLLAGEVSYQRANDSQKDWYDATVNLPLEESDQLYSGSNGRAEIQLSGRNLIRIDRDTNLRFTQFNTGLAQMALPVGTATFRIDTLDRRQFQVVDAGDIDNDEPVYFEVDTPVVAITLLKEGIYRVNVREDGTTEVIVWRGKAEVYQQEIGTISLKQGRRIVIEGNDPNLYRIARTDDKDEWDRWNDRRDDELWTRAESYRSARYIPAALPGVYDLDIYGDWYESPDYGWIWAPRAVPAGWAPYRQGYWRWYGAHGWTWISSEPWGWVPYHYGRWAWHRSRWYWVPSVGFGVGVGFNWRWSPHMVVFFGWGDGRYSRGYRDGFRDGYWTGYRDGRGWMGWCPLAPGEPYYGRTVIVNNTTVVNNYPRSIDRLRNYEAPGGVSGIESRRFTEQRVVQITGPMTAPPRGRAGAVEPESSGFVRVEDVRPAQPATPARTALVERREVARRIETPAPIVVRRQITEGVNAAPGRNIEGRMTAPPRADRPGEVQPGAPSRSTPPTRIEEGQIVRPERPTRAPDYRPVERVPAPDPDRTRRVERSESPVQVPAPTRQTSPPARIERPSRSESPTRIEPTPRRVEPPRESAPPRQIERPAPPPRESAPPRQVERPAPPPRESAPPRQVERPAPPPRESAPQRAPEKTERPAPPTRKPPE